MSRTIFISLLSIAFFVSHMHSCVAQTDSLLQICRPLATHELKNSSSLLFNNGGISFFVMTPNQVNDLGSESPIYPSQVTIQRIKIVSKHSTVSHKTLHDVISVDESQFVILSEVLLTLSERFLVKKMASNEQYALMTKHLTGKYIVTTISDGQRCELNLVSRKNSMLFLKEYIVCVNKSSINQIVKIQINRLLEAKINDLEIN